MVFVWVYFLFIVYNKEMFWLICQDFMLLFTDDWLTYLIPEGEWVTIQKELHALESGLNVSWKQWCRHYFFFQLALTMPNYLFFMNIQCIRVICVLRPAAYWRKRCKWKYIWLDTCKDQTACWQEQFLLLVKVGINKQYSYFRYFCSYLTIVDPKIFSRHVFLGCVSWKPHSTGDGCCIYK